MFMRWTWPAESASQGGGGRDGWLLRISCTLSCWDSTLLTFVGMLVTALERAACEHPAREPVWQARMELNIEVPATKGLRAGCALKWMF